MENAVQRWLVNTSQFDPSPELFTFLVSLLPPHERPAITRFLKTEDRKRALVSRLLQYSIAHQVLGLPFRDVSVGRTAPEGKPYLRNPCGPYPNFNFSVSHCGDFVGIASEPVCLVGLDIVSGDRVSSGRDHQAVLDFVGNFRSCFAEREWRSIAGAGHPDAVSSEFCRYWSLKEAYVKALGAGIGYGLDSFQFFHDDWINISVSGDGVDSKEWRFWLYDLGGDNRHWASVARGHPRTAVDSYRRTLPRVDFGEEEYRDGLALPSPNFTICSVEQLIPVTSRQTYDFLCDGRLQHK